MKTISALFGLGLAAFMLAGCVYDDGYYRDGYYHGYYRDGYYRHGCGYYGDCYHDRDRDDWR